MYTFGSTCGLLEYSFAAIVLAFEYYNKYLLKYL